LKIDTDWNVKTQKQIKSNDCASVKRNVYLYYLYIQDYNTEASEAHFNTCAYCFRTYYGGYYICTTVSVCQYKMYMKCVYVYIILSHHTIRICAARFLKKKKRDENLQPAITDFLFFCLLLYYRNIYTRVTTKRDVQ